MALCIYAFWQFGFLQCDKCINAFQHHVKCHFDITTEYLLEYWAIYNKKLT